MREGATALARLPVPSHPEHHFVFDASKLSFYAASIYAWLGQAERAVEHGTEVVSQCLAVPDVIRWPVRLAETRVDLLGLVAVQRDQLETRRTTSARSRSLRSAGRGAPSAESPSWTRSSSAAIPMRRRPATSTSAILLRRRASSRRPRLEQRKPDPPRCARRPLGIGLLVIKIALEGMSPVPDRPRPPGRRRRRHGRGGRLPARSAFPGAWCPGRTSPLWPWSPTSPPTSCSPGPSNTSLAASSAS
jgi:hypothetical protein